MSAEQELREREAFLQLLRALVAPGARLDGFFPASGRIGIARAPGRLDVMGGIADYSGSLVLELPIREAAFCAASLHPDPEVRVVTVSPEPPHDLRQVSLPAGPLLAASYSEAGEMFRRIHGGDWAAYVAGPLVALVREGALRGVKGVRIVIASRVPEGKGVSSSAAIEVAALFALASAAELPVSAHEAALLCQRAENLVVGAPCGVMDPITSALGIRGRVIELLCQPAIVNGTLPIPEGVGIYGIDSGVRHAVRGASYGQVRVAAFMGYRILAEALGLTVHATETEGRVQIEDSTYGGYLANLTPERLDAGLLGCLPVRLKGADFLRRYGGITDFVTRVDPDQIYPVRPSTEHPVREHQRVKRFAALLRKVRSTSGLEELGALMLDSHASYSACGLGSDATDHLVRLVRERGAAKGLFGAKVTGGGSGGTVAVLASQEAEPAIFDLAKRYSEESGRPSRVFVGSSAGAEEFGTLVISGDRLVN